MAAEYGMEDDELPPPYSSTSEPFQLSSNVGSSSSSSSSSTPGTSLFASHLTALHTNLRANRAIQASVKEQKDNEALAVIIPHIEYLLSSIADIHPSPSLVEATIIPDTAVGAGWSLTEKDEKLRGELRKVVKVRKDAKCIPDVKGEKGKSYQKLEQTRERDPNRGFDEWGRWKDDDDSGDSDSQKEHLLWWKDESMAYRLAKYLRPERATLSVDRQTVKQFVAQKQAKSRWGLFRKEEVTSPPPPTPPAAPVSVRNRPVDKNVTMSVAAEEVTFRKENEMGIWESKTGWGVVLTIRIRR